VADARRCRCRGRRRARGAGVAAWGRAPNRSAERVGWPDPGRLGDRAAADRGSAECDAIRDGERRPHRRTDTPPATPAPRTSTAPRLAYAAFLRRINDDRATVDRLNANLSAAVQAQDPVATRPAAVAILDFVDRERDWLRDNPPADCYAAAHQEAGTMLDAYGMAADAFIAWADTGGGLAGLAALGDAVDLAQTAAAVSTMFGQTLDATRCPS